MLKKKKEVIIVVDLLNDFIDGSLACLNGNNAVNESIKFINDSLIPTIYIADSHPNNHCSFKEYGGIWPSHCVKNSKGGEFHKDFYSLISFQEYKPNIHNTFYKGEDPKKEEYSGYYAKNSDGETLIDWLTKQEIDTLYICGVATEYCINDTVNQLNNANFDIVIIEKALSYVDYQEHKKRIQSFIDKGIKLL